MAKPVVILVGADKGGVGKTTVTRTLLDYFIAHKFPRALSTPKRRRARSGGFIPTSPTWSMCRRLPTR